MLLHHSVIAFLDHTSQSDCVGRSHYSWISDDASSPRGAEGSGRSLRVWSWSCSAPARPGGWPRIGGIFGHPERPQVVVGSNLWAQRPCSWCGKDLWSFTSSQGFFQQEPRSHSVFNVRICYFVQRWKMSVLLYLRYTYSLKPVESLRMFFFLMEKRMFISFF